MKRFVLATALLAVVGAAWLFNPLGFRSVVPHGSVATLFDETPPHPGYRWSRDGYPTAQGEITTIAGPGHCSWQDMTMMFIGWPPGTAAATSASSRMYVRDPKGVYLEGQYRESLDLDAVLPTDAQPTGYQLAGVEIYVSPLDWNDAVYLVGRDAVERWPRVDPMRLCA